MKLSLREYDAMQSGWRKWINEHMEIGGFRAWGMDFTGKDILEVGCGSGYSASLIVKDHPKSYTGMDIMLEQLRFIFDAAVDSAGRSYGTIRKAKLDRLAARLKEKQREER